MSEKEELARLAKRKKQIENKYAKLAKRRLNELNKRVAPKLDLMDMTENEFDNFVNQLVGMINKNSQLQNNHNQGKNQQQQHPKNNQNNNHNRG